MPSWTKSSKNADRLLPRDVTQQFIDFLSVVLLEDGGEKVDVLRKMWLTKYCGLSLSDAVLRQDKAIEKWLATETTNARSNARLASKAARSFLWSGLVTYERLLAKARSVCFEILGETPSLAAEHGGFSGGASTSKRRSDGHPAVKFLEKAHVTPDAYNLFYDVIRGTRWHDNIDEVGLETSLIQGNVLFTVPKNSEIDRVAAKEPDLNLFLQKMFGNQIRTCLKRVGIDLNDQSINGRLARKGSIDGSLMTLDLSSASDSVSIELVRALLPANWFYYLSCVRSPFTKVRDEWHENAMYSSMGNGFTFELESLLFYALTRAAAYFLGVRGRIGIYGDDIIAPSSMYEELTRALAFCGFKLNEEKSFHEGPFRESCGAYWYAGVDVKPFFLKGPLTRVSDLILVLNNLVRWASVEGVFDPRYEEVFNLFKGYVPSQLWGGQDLTSRTSLVTGDAPRKELRSVVKAKSINQRGLLLLWLLNHPDHKPLSDQRRNSLREAAVKLKRERLDNRGIGDVTSQLGFCRLKRNKSPQTDVPIFMSRYVLEQTGLCTETVPA